MEDSFSLASLPILAMGKAANGEMKIAQFPRRSNVYVYEQTIIGKTFEFEIHFDWPDENLKAGDSCSINRGSTLVGQIIGFYYQGAPYLARLIDRNPRKGITVQGEDGEILQMDRGEYEILGSLVKNLYSLDLRPTIITPNNVLAWRASVSGLSINLGLDWTFKTGQSLRAAQNVGWLHLIHPDYREPVMNERAAARRAGLPFNIPLMMRKASGVYAKGRAFGTPVLADGIIEAWQGFIQLF
jgi:hypothetical protein